MATIDVSWSRRPDGGAIDLEVLKRKSWEGVTAYFVKIAAPVTYDFKLKSNSNYISLHDFYRVDGETRVSGLARSTAKDLRNKIAFIPAGCDISGWTKIDKPAAIVVVVIDDRKLGRQQITLSDLPPRIDFDDPMLRSLLLRFQSILDDPSLDTPGYAETLAELVSYEVLRATSPGRCAQGGQSGLTTSRCGSLPNTWIVIYPKRLPSPNSPRWSI